MRKEGVLRHTRNGDAYVLPCPLTTVYLSPRERVLRWARRDANPFFHLMEALWMLAGREDVAFVDEFNSKIKGYSDNGVTFNGAYGYRWCQYFGYDQVNLIISQLKANPDCRRQVLQMWDAARDHGSASKDVPCNTNAYPQINVEGQLDLMVCNRSNDLIWGAYGANAVHFSVLQEYMAAAIGVPVGAYYQVSMNTHLYVGPHGWMLDEDALGEKPDEDLYADQGCEPFPLMSLPKNRWDREMVLLVERGPEDCPGLDDPFLEAVVRPLWLAWRAFKEGGPERVGRAQEQLRSCAAQDWSRAAFEWLERRRKA
jgi:hypothetical protein